MLIPVSIVVLFSPVTRETGVRFPDGEIFNFFLKNGCVCVCVCVYVYERGWENISASVLPG